MTGVPERVFVQKDQTARLRLRTWGGVPWSRTFLLMMMASPS